ncbi:MAG: hypothetical protein WKF75_06270 [Singulisphaera sp.]
MGRSGETGRPGRRHPKYPANIAKNWVLSQRGSGGLRIRLPRRCTASGVLDGSEYDLA